MTAEQREQLREMHHISTEQTSFNNDTLNISRNVNDPSQSSASMTIDIDTNVTVDNPDIIHKVKEFHNTLATSQNVVCNVCSEHFYANNNTPSKICCCCNLDTQLPKLFSSQNNMDPGPVPFELSVSCINVIYLLIGVVLMAAITSHLRHVCL